MINHESQMTFQQEEESLKSQPLKVEKTDKHLEKIVNDVLGMLQNGQKDLETQEYYQQNKEEESPNFIIERPSDYNKDLNMLSYSRNEDSKERQSLKDIRVSFKDDKNDTSKAPPSGRHGATPEKHMMRFNSKSSLNISDISVTPSRKDNSHIFDRLVQDAQRRLEQKRKIQEEKPDERNLNHTDLNLR